MFSLAATPSAEVPRANTSVPADPRNFLSTFGSNLNRLPPGVALPGSAQFSANGQGDPSSSSSTAGFPGFAGMPLRPGTASSANLLGNPVLANQQPAPLSAQQTAASESKPLASGLASGWSIVASPNATAGETTNILNGTTCLSASDCWAVGMSSTGTVLRTLVEHWDGTSWAVVPSPNTSATHHNLLYGVACVSAADCWAVGGGWSDADGVFQTLIERWDGTAWAIVTSPNNKASPSASATTNIFFGVTCVSAADCWAVGGYDPGPFRQTLVARWDGIAWAIVTSPNSSTTQSNSLSGVTCVSASACWAVGSADTGVSSSQTLIQRWDGTSWAIATSANIPAAQNGILQAVTCVAASECWAVGYNSFTGLDDQTLIERWDGTSWAIAPSPDQPAYSNRLYGVTCASASDCWAVGREDTGNPLFSPAYQTLVVRWNGTVWTTVTSPNTSTTQVNFLEAVTCVSGSDCWAVGYFATADDQTLIERWDGNSWAIVTSDNATSVPTNILQAVTCVSTADCWAVGYSAGGAGQTLTEHWDGTAWAMIASPDTNPALNNLLYEVACVSSSDCWAVGYHDTASGSQQTLIERWDGTSRAWNIVSSPNNTATSTGALNSVTCMSASDCWAVGSSTASGGAILTLIEHWDGAVWATVTSPNASAATQNTLLGVSCVSAASCWAVGYAPVGLNDQTLIERWDGTTWAVVTSANSSTTENNSLRSVTCVSAADCWAVGYVQASSYRTLIERWDGTSWAIVTSPSGTGTNFLNGVTCAAASDCWAIGYSFPASAIQTLIERWDGTSWAIVTSPNTSATQHNILQSVTCASASECWAVGYFIPSTGVRTLIEKYSLTVPPLTGVVSRMTHGSAGSLDINLPLTGTRGVECRSSASLGAGNYTVVFTFVNNVTSCGTAGTVGGSVSSGPDPNQCTENLTGVPNAQYTTVTLNNVLDSQNNTGNVAATMGVLIGDVNATGLVDGNDVSAVQGQARQSANSTNFRLDVNATGLIDGNDVSLVQSKTRTSLPSPP
jgi:hypothetical protein